VIRRALLFVAIVACQKPDAASDPPAPAPVTTPPPGLPTPRTMTCEALVPPAIADRFMPGYAMKATMSRRGLDCRYTAAGTPLHMVDLAFKCRSDAPPEMRGMIDHYKQDPKNASAREVAGLGAGAILLAPDSPQPVLQFWDDDTDCEITLSALGNDLAKDPVPLARALVAAIAP